MLGREILLHGCKQAGLNTISSVQLAHVVAAGVLGRLADVVVGVPYAGINLCAAVLWYG